MMTATAGSGVPNRLRRAIGAVVTVTAAAVGVIEQPRLLVGFFVCACLFIPLEALIPLMRRPLRRDIHVDVVHTFANRLPITLAVSAALTLLAPAAHEAFPDAARDALKSLPGWAQFVLLLLVVDFVNYLAHRALHEVPALWRLHAVHHSSENLDWLSTARGHPLDQIINITLVSLPFYLLDLGVEFSAAFVAFQFYYPFLAHANTRIMLRPLSRVLVTPAFHHWHHANEPEAVNRNYATVFSFWDWLFGTGYCPDRAPRAYGIEQPMPTTWLGQLASPFRANAPQDGAVQPAP